MTKLNWQNLTVMVVDDNSFVRKLVTNTVRSLGITEIVTASSAKEAIQALALSRKDPIEAGFGTIDIILSDFVMPEVDGSLFLRWVRTSKQAPDRFSPFVMISGAADQSVVRAARDAGVTEFLAKPFSANSVAERILEVVKNPRQFVLAPGYFGPDRRRQGRVGDPLGSGQTTGKPAKERRVTKKSEIQVVHTQSSARSLRDDVRAIYFRPSNKLREKLGPNAMRGPIDFDPLVIEAADQRTQELVGDYSTWVSKYLTSINKSYVALSGGMGESKQHLLNINQIAHELRGQGGIFDYPLITAFGKTLYEATSDAGAKVSEYDLKLIKAHIDAMQLVFNQQVRGDGGEIGVALLAEIDRAVRKHGEGATAARAS